MSLRRYDPFAELSRLRESMDQLFDQVSGRPRGQGQRTETVWLPPVELYAEGNEAVVRLELPNVDPNSVDVTVNGDLLTVKGEIRQEQAQQKRTYYVREFWSGQFARSVRLPFDAEADQAKATFTNGILEIRVPQSEQAKPKRIQVEVQGGQQQLSTGQGEAQREKKT